MCTDVPHPFSSWLKRWLAPKRVRTIRRTPLPQLLLLESRTVPSTTFTVTNTNDSGTGSLRAAITSANSTSGADTIAFSNVSGAGVTNFSDGAAHTITLSSALPTITDSVAIHGAGPAVTIISAPTITTSPGFRIFSIDDGSATSALEVDLYGMTLQHGHLIGASASDSAAGVAGGAIEFRAGTSRAMF
jgi:hypothetical protein